jgi:hypothetical protein
MPVVFLDPPLLLLLTLLLVALLLLSFCCYKADGLVIIYTNFPPAAIGGTAIAAAVGHTAAVYEVLLLDEVHFLYKVHLFS